MSRSNETQLITCYACGKPLFVERYDSSSRYRREEITDEYFYDEVGDVFLCNNCHGGLNEVKKNRS